jgi:hypothetical protein
MSAITENRPDVARLLEVVEQLSPSELNIVEKRLRTVKAQQKAALALTSEEKRRLAEIVHEVPEESRNRYSALVELQREGTLRDEEHEELVRLSDWIELVEVKRLEYLAELARQRSVPLLTLMDLLGIKSPSYA